MANVTVILSQRLKDHEPLTTITVKGGYARYLLSRGIAKRNTKENIQSLENQRDALMNQDMKQKEEAQKLCDALDGMTLSIMRKVVDVSSGRLYGSVSSRHIAEELKEHGYHVDKKYIRFEPANKIGKFDVKLIPYTGVSASMVLEIQMDTEHA